MPRLSPFTTDTALAPLFAEETVKASQERLFHLITLVVPDNADPLQIVDANHDVTFDTVTYAMFPCKFNGASVNIDGSIDKTNITIANVSRVIMSYINQYNGLRGCRVKVKTVFANACDNIYTLDPTNGNIIATPNVGNPTAYIEDEYYVDTYTANETTVVFQLDPIIDLEVRIPRRRYVVDSCYWTFKGPECKYAGVLTTCALNFADCKAHNNLKNFGGFPGISGSRRILL